MSVVVKSVTAEDKKRRGALFAKRETKYFGDGDERMTAIADVVEDNVEYRKMLECYWLLESVTNLDRDGKPVFPTLPVRDMKQAEFEKIWNGLHPAVVGRASPRGSTPQSHLGPATPGGIERQLQEIADAVADNLKWARYQSSIKDTNSNLRLIPAHILFKNGEPPPMPDIWEVHLRIKRFGPWFDGGISSQPEMLLRLLEACIIGENTYRTVHLPYLQGLEKPNDGSQQFTL